MKDIILASKSPRRKELLRKLDIPFKIISKETDETFISNMNIYENIKNIARNKALVILEEHNKSIVIGIDTVVYLNDTILQKPKTKEEARNMITMLSGKTHEVISGIAVISKEKEVITTLSTSVTFDELSYEEIEEYISTDEPYDKAGGYGIQGRAAKFITKISGDYYNVVGLSINTLYKILKDF